MNENQPQPDSIYQAYNKTLYRMGGEDQDDPVTDMLLSNPSADNSSSVETAAENIGSGKLERPWARMHLAQFNHASCWAGESCLPVELHGDGKALQACRAPWNAAEFGSIPWVLYP